MAQENGSGDDQHAQENTRRKVVVSNETRRLIFEALLAKARNGYLKGQETTEVSMQFSVPLRTVQRIWKKGKSCLDQGLLVGVSTFKCKVQMWPQEDGSGCVVAPQCSCVKPHNNT